MNKTNNWETDLKEIFEKVNKHQERTKEYNEEVHEDYWVVKSEEKVEDTEYNSYVSAFLIGYNTFFDNIPEETFSAFLKSVDSFLEWLGEIEPLVDYITKNKSLIRKMALSERPNSSRFIDTVLLQFDDLS